jgi:hypothetical protein
MIAVLCGSFPSLRMRTGPFGGDQRITSIEIKFQIMNELQNSEGVDYSSIMNYSYRFVKKRDKKSQEQHSNENLIAEYIIHNKIFHVLKYYDVVNIAAAGEYLWLELPFLIVDKVCTILSSDLL